jgi:hypothetical protein
MSNKKSEAATDQAQQVDVVSKYPLETILTVSLCVPIAGDPSSAEAVWGLPVLFWGPPGIGKSERAETASGRLGLGCEVIFPSTMQPEDVNGVLIPDGKGGAVKICMIDGVRKLIAAGKGVLFVDEVTGARPATQGALLGAILKRQFGDVKMPNSVRIVAAANPPEQAAGGWDLEPPMSNRFAHFDIGRPRAEEWVNYLLSQNLPRDTSILDYEDVLKANWGPAWAKSQGFFAGFHNKTNGRLLNKMPAEESKDRSHARPSSRTWTFAARAAATHLALRPVLAEAEDLMLDFISACIGTGAAGEFTTWLREANLPNPEDVLRNGWSPDKLRIDRNHAVYTSMVAFVIGTKEEDKRLKYAAQAYDVLDMASDAGLKDLIAPMVAQLVNRGLSVAMIHSPDPAKKRVGEVSARILTKLGKTKIGSMIREFKEPT